MIAGVTIGNNPHKRPKDKNRYGDLGNLVKDSKGNSEMTFMIRS